MSSDPDAATLIDVVDDTPDVLELVSTMVRKLGFTARGFSSGDECLEAIAVRRPAAVLMDLHMPGRAGDECCRLIKEKPGNATLPVIILTAADAPHEVMQSWRAGADDFLPKPVRLAALQAKLSAIRADESAAAPPPAPAGRSVLLVDDSRFYRSVLGGALEQSGFQVVYAADAAQAMTKARSGQAIDAVVTDLVMPRTDGLTLARLLRALPSFQSTPMVMLSGQQPEPGVGEEIEQVTGGPLLLKKELPLELILTRITGVLKPIAVELRAAERVPFFSVVRYRVAGTQEWLSGFSYDLSGGGIFVRSLTPTEAGSELEMQVKFTFRSPPPTSRGTVVWSNRFGGRRSYSYPVGMGVRFTDLESEDRAAVQRLVGSAASAAGPMPAP